MKTKHILLALALVLVVSSSGFAQEPITVIELIDHLDEARLKAWGSKESQYGRKKNERILNQFSRFISC